MNKRSSTTARVLKLLGGHIPALVLSALFAAAIVVTTLAVPILIGRAIDLMAEGAPVDFNGVIGILTITAIVIDVTALLQWLMTSINNRITYHVVRDMRNAAFEKLERLPLSYIDSHKKGDVVSRIISDVDQFADGLLLGFTQLFTGVLTIVGTLAFMIAISWKIALVVVVLTPISLFVARFIGTHTHDMFKVRAKTTGEQTAIIDEMIGNQKIVTAFSQEAAASASFDEVNARLEKCSLKAIFFSSLVNPTTRFVNNIVYAAVALVGALTAIATAGAAAPFTIGSLTCLLSYTNQYTKPFNEISGVITEFQNALACAGRYFELVDEAAEQPDAEDAISLSGVQGNVQLEDVSFSYDKEKKLLENINVSIPAGRRAAIVGPTGCGKTTLINLLMRFYDVDSGGIEIDSHSISDITRRSLRESYGMVLQETWLTSGTIRDNIAFGNPEAPDEEIIAAAKAAHAHSFIKRLERGYDTVVGEGDGKLSEGQKQLICIARIMLTSPPMLILDEATSSIDTRTEIKIQDAFAKIMEGRTSFIVAHRLSTVEKCDIILVMKDGNIVEQGSHRELLRRGGFYRELYDSQFAKSK